MLSPIDKIDGPKAVIEVECLASYMTLHSAASSAVCSTVIRLRGIMLGCMALHSVAMLGFVLDFMLGCDPAA